MATQVAELSVDELRLLIQDVVRETIEELFQDPDKGLELRDDLKEKLLRSVKSVQEGGETYSAETIAASLGLDW